MEGADPTITETLGHLRRQARALARGRAPLGVVVACSGGPDSVALLGLLARSTRSERLRLVVAHVDHRLRAESAREAMFVRDLAGELGLPAFVRRVALPPGPGLPARARSERRRALVGIALEVDAQVIALGHTATDQAETMLLHLCRGAGLAGLAAMRPHDPWTHDDAGDRAGQGEMWRPLLGIDRDTTRHIATALALPFVDDPTNLDASHPRVRLRAHVLPQLRAVRPGVDVALARAAQHAADADEALDEWARRELAARRRADTDPPRFSSEQWAGLPRAVRTRMLRLSCAQEGVATDALFSRTIAAVDAAFTGGGREARTWDLHPRRRLRAVARLFWVERRGGPARGATIDPLRGGGYAARTRKSSA